MNYIAEINAFEKWLEGNYLPAASQLLWYKLLMLFNRCGWSEWITVDNQRLMALIQIKRDATFIEQRNKLVEAGLISYQRGKKGSPNRYKLNQLTFTSEVNSVVDTVVQSEVKTEAQTADINKRNVNETKQEKKEEEIISLLMKDGSCYPVYPSQVKEWSELYPAVDVMQELRKMKGWSIANPTKRKTRKCVLRFINNWLSKEQDKGGNRNDSARPAQPGTPRDTGQGQKLGTYL